MPSIAPDAEDEERMAKENLACVLWRCVSRVSCALPLTPFSLSPPLLPLCLTAQQLMMRISSIMEGSNAGYQFMVEDDVKDDDDEDEDEDGGDDDDDSNDAKDGAQSGADKD